VNHHPPRRLLLAALLALQAPSLLPQAMAAQTDSPPPDVRWQGTAESAQAEELTRMLDRIERSGDVIVYRLQLASAETVLGGAPRGDSVRAVLGSESGAIAVLYPDLGEPYRGIFAKIIEGVEAQVGARVASYAVGGNTTEQDILASLKRQDVKVVIALGRQGMKAASGLARDYGVVVGGVVSAPEDEARNYSVISLAPDPGMLFERLKHFMPSARRVVVVYDPRQNAWLIRLAREAARKHGLELQALEASDLKTAVRVYQEQLAVADPKRDALWLPQDTTTVEESSVLPLVLEGAWNRSLAVFSSSVAHVKRGALFSLYPNNLALGRQLAASALNYPAGGSPAASVSPLKDALLAVNVRTASHLGLPVSSVPNGIDLVFPSQR
jgi:putative ABC transport system substrate-binding protein